MMENKTKQLTRLSLLIAVLVIQTFVPGIGYIPIGPIQATIIHITVIVGACLFGRKTGFVLGLSWGVLRMIKAMLMPDILSVVFINPLVSVLPRLLVGWISGIVADFLGRYFSTKVSYTLTGVIGSIVNTITVLTAIYFFAGESYANALGIPETALMATFIAAMGSNGVLEAVVSGILTPLLATPLARGIKQSKLV